MSLGDGTDDCLGRVLDFVRPGVVAITTQKTSAPSLCQYRGMHLRMLALSLFLVACGNERDSSLVGQPSGTAPVFDPSSYSAEETYRQAIRAWNEGNRDGYFAAYAERLDCWYDEAGFSRAQIERGPRGARFRSGSPAAIIVESLRAVRSGPSEVMLIDEGHVQSQGSDRAHRKLIVMRRVEGAWRIVVEVSPSRHRCWQELPEGFGTRSSSRPGTAQRVRSQQGCRVIRIEEECQDTAGTPPCREIRAVDDAPPVPPGADRREAVAALAAYAEDVNCELTPSYGPTGRVARLAGHCMGVGATTYIYQGCE